ncbi:MAG: carboxymuconolactone decarboxylase family protein [Acidimicrobiales bacterium]|nr:carboxymuconolactone decarboxylase family protein [Acidimicrobiales bacterium]
MTAVEVETEERMSIRDVDPDAYKAMAALSGYVNKGSLGKALHAIVDIRASQINHCAWCLDMHTEQAREAGISQRRIDLIAAWQEAGSLFSAREQAALALTEAVTLIADHGVPDDVWDAVKAEFSDAEIVQLIMAIGAINVYNRMNVTVRAALGDEPYRV